MAVDSGRMTMLTACQQYDISARTFYRWLRNKERLIQLTGFTEEDFKNGTLQTDKEAFPDQDAHRMPPQRDVEANLPRLPNQPAVTPQDPRVAKDPAQDPAAPGPPAPVFPGAGAKRRMPKAVDHSRDYGQPGADGYATPNSAFYRRNFTKMPSQAQLARDPPPPVDRQTAARNSTRMRRETWHPPEPENVDPQYTSDDRNYPPTFIDSRSNSPQDSYKRRKVARTETPVAADEQQDTVADEPMPEQPVDAAVQEQFTNGAADHPPQPVQRPHPQPNPVSQSTRMPPNGTASKRDITGQDPVADPRGPRKHRIEIMMGRRKVTIAWYDGASAADIKAAIARRFALLPGTQWALMDRAYDEIVISDGVPSGRYTLTVFS